MRRISASRKRGHPFSFEETHSLLSKALFHAKKLKKNDPYNGEDPYTEVGELVQILTSLKIEH